jgi:putative lipoic acid-binding regulatory protein
MVSEEFNDDTDSLFNFPCEFPVKAMGRACPELEAAVIEIMQRHVPDLGEGAISIRASGKGNYVAITVLVQARSREQLDAIYMDLTACEHVLYAI